MLGSISYSMLFGKLLLLGFHMATYSQPKNRIELIFSMTSNETFSLKKIFILNNLFLINSLRNKYLKITHLTVYL